ncbi:putative membrane protein [Candidatus Ichthyocystis hellenicum]|uniref:Putative membrane protein n=1 Tax=Candidatus Ichthyocystis hellenicum TaxID=1561003 RepID=A0A0S4M1A2_9BURK|nr:hypothetical protein [Candidatus Ichthyocystis hellenicum]CUT17545.1 putative membrane protein [Candidatus Ichthyocystis hellenicum]
MQKCSSASGASVVDAVGCACDACHFLREGSGPVGTESDGWVSVRDFFSYDDEGNDSDTYLSLLREANGIDLDEVKSAVNFSEDGLVTLKPALSSSSKVMIVLAVLLVLLVISFVVFALLSYTGVIYVSPNLMSDIIRWGGVGVCSALLGYSLLGLGCLLGHRVKDKREGLGAILESSCVANLKDYGSVQEAIDSDFDRCNREFESVRSRLVMISDFAASVRGKHIEDAMKQIDILGNDCVEIERKIKLVRGEIRALGKCGKTKTGDFDFLDRDNARLVADNARLVADNARLRLELSDLLSSLRAEGKS